MPVTVYEPAEGVRLLAIPENAARFKTAALSVELLLPLAEESAAEQAILPFLLRRGCRAYPDFSALKRRLDRLYGAEVTASVGRVGEAQALYLQVTCLDDRFALAGEAVAAECAELLRGMLFEPPLQNGLFAADAVEEERRCLLENIRAEINNKRGYARLRCEQQLCAGEPYAVRPTGTAEQVEALTPAQITAAWQRMLATARVQILYHGNADARTVAAPFFAGFAAIDRHPAALPVTRHRPGSEIADAEETMAVVQSKMVLGICCTADAAGQDTPALRLANAVFGGTAFSMLFRTVREKLSLCYYCAASFDRLKGVGMIDSGVQAEKIPAARAEILRQLSLLQAGGFSDEDFENTRRFMISQYHTVGDLQSSLVSWYASQALDDAPLSPGEAAEELAAVTRERLVAAARTLKPVCEFRLMPDGEEGEDDDE